MEVWINDAEIIGRINERIANLNTETHTGLTQNGIASKIMAAIHDGKLTHEAVIDFCLATQTSYRYIVLGVPPIYDTDKKNDLYKRLIEKSDYTL